jgi:hypothetical protein
MATSTLSQWREASDPRYRALFLFNALVAMQVIAALVYGVVFEVTPTRVTTFLLPFVWIAVSVLAVWWTEPADRAPRLRLLGGAIAGGYLLVFLYLSGTIGLAPDQFEAVTGALGIGVETERTLGWGPVVFYSGEVFGARIHPYQLVGYITLSYLVYAAVLDSVRSASAGMIGVALCPACALAAVSPIFASLAGTVSAFALFFQYNYEIATVIFVGAVGLLYWRPSLTVLRRETSARLAPMAGGLAGFVAVLHLAHPTHGIGRFVQYLQLGALYDPRPLLFTLSGLAIVAGLTFAYAGADREPLYLLGIGLMLVYILGYVSWHAFLGHGAFWPGIEGTGHTDETFVESVALHLLNDPYAMVSKLAEVTLAGLLVVLYRRS